MLLAIFHDTSASRMQNNSAKPPKDEERVIAAEKASKTLRAENSKLIVNCLSV